MLHFRCQTKSQFQDEEGEDKKKEEDEEKQDIEEDGAVLCVGLETVEGAIEITNTLNFTTENWPKQNGNGHIIFTKQNTSQTE